MQHTGGMRFGHFPDRQYPLESFAIDAVDATIRLVTDWSRYAGRRQFCIEFPAAPRFRSMWYEIFAPNGDLIDSYPAATVLHWHFRRLQRDGENVVFAPKQPGESCSRDERQSWIREVLWRALPIAETEARLSVQDVTPHSLRPGLACDLHREGVAIQRIGSICRWNTARASGSFVHRAPMFVYDEVDEWFSTN